MIANLYEFLITNYPEEAADILWALQYDPFSREVIHHDKFFSSMLEEVPQGIENWRVGKLALFAAALKNYHIKWDKENTFSHLIDAVDYVPRIENVADFSPSATCYDEIGIDALELFHLTAKSASENDTLVTTIDDVLKNPDESSYPLWQSILVSYSGLLREPSEMACSLIKNKEWKANLSLAVLIICSNYFGLDVLVEQFKSMLDLISWSSNIFVLRFLYQNGKYVLVQALAKHLKQCIKSEKTESSQAGKFIAMDELLRVDYVGASVDLFAGEHIEPMGEKGPLAQNFGERSMLEDFSKVFGEEDRHSTRHQMELDSLICLSNDADYVQDSSIETPFSIAKQSYHFSKIGDVEKSQYYAEKSLENLEYFLENGGSSKIPRYIKQFQFAKIVQLLKEAGFLTLAAKAGERILDAYPCDIQTHLVLRDVHQANGKRLYALRYAFLPLALLPQHEETFMSVSYLYADLSEQEKAYQYSVLHWQNTSQNMTMQDQIKLCDLALLSGQIDIAQEIGEQFDESEIAANYAANKMLGRIYSRIGDHSLAAKHFELACGLVKDDAEIFVLLSRAYAALGTGNDIEILEKGLELFPDSAVIHAELAQKYHYQGLAADAARYLDRAKALQPDTKNCVSIIAGLLNETSDPVGALTYYQNAFEIFNYDAGIGRRMLNFALEAGSFTVARQCLSRLSVNFIPDADDEIFIARTIYEGQSPILSQAFQCKPGEISSVYNALKAAIVSGVDNPDLYLLFAETAAYLEDYDSAISYYLQLMELSSSGVETWRVAGGLGYVSLKLGQYDTAIAGLREALIDQFSEYKLGKLLAEALAESGLEEDAMYYARDFYNKIPESEAAVSWYADICSKFGKYEEAISVLLVACQESPDNLAFSIHLAELMLKNQQDVDAKIIIESFFDLTINVPEHCWRIVKLYLRIRDWEGAGIFIRRHLDEISEKYPAIYFALSYLYLQLGELETSFEYSQQAINSAVDDERVYIFQSDILYQMGRPEAALSCLDFALQLFHAQPDRSCSDQLSEIAQILIAPQWEMGFETERGIELRQIFLLTKALKIDEALQLANRSLNESKEDALFQFFVAAISMMKGDFHLAASLLEKSGQTEDALAKSALMSCHIEFLILTNRLSGLSRLLDDDAAKLPITPQILAAQSIHSARYGQWNQSKDLFDQAAYIFENKANESLAELNSISIGYNLVEDVLADLPASLVTAASKLFLWKESGKLIRRFIGQSARADHLLGCINGLLIHAEWSRICDELEIINHHPEKAPFEENQEVFVFSSLEQLSPVVTGLKLERWVTYANLVYCIDELDFSRIGRTLNLPEDVELLLSALRWHGLFDKAVEVSERLSAHVRNPWQRALCYIKDNVEAGYQVAQTHLDAEENSPISYYVVAKFAAEIEEYQTAREAIAEAIAVWPNEPNWNFLASEIAGSLDEYEERRNFLLQAFESDKTNLQYAFMLCDEYQQEELHIEAVQVLTTVRQFASNAPNFWARYSEAHLLLGEKGKAFEYAEKMRNLAPESYKPYLHLAKISASIAEHEAALAYAQTAYDKNPEEPDVLILLSEIFEWSGEMQEAENLLERAILSGHKNTRLVIRYAIVKRKRNGSQSIIHLLEELREEEDKNPQLLSLLTEVYMDCGEFRKAEETAASTLKLKSYNPKIKLLLGKLKRINGQLDLAVHHISEALLDDPQMLEAYLELASIYEERREIEQAIRVYKMAISAIPENYKPYYQAGLLMQENKEFLEAEVMLKRAAELSPDNITIRRKLGAVVALNLVHNTQEV